MELTCQNELCLSCWKNALCSYLTYCLTSPPLSYVFFFAHARRDTDMEEEINVRTIYRYRSTVLVL